MNMTQEQQRIADYQRGFNDAALSRVNADPMNLAYALGYSDGRKS
jgi:hypothetical protein